MKNILNTLVTDRTQEDADRAIEMDRKGWSRMTEKERAEYAGGPRGAYTKHDLNRAVGVMEYLDSLMSVAGVESGYQPVSIQHKTDAGTWTDTVWIDEDKPRPSQWAAHISNVYQFWNFVSHIDAAVKPKWDPHGNGYIFTDETLAFGDICEILDSNGLLSITASISCDSDKISASGDGWTVSKTAGKITAAYLYRLNLFPDLGDALRALSVWCEEEDGVIDAAISFSASLRYGKTVQLGTCAVRWSSVVIWAEASELHQNWASTSGLTWAQFERGG